MTFRIAAPCFSMLLLLAACQPETEMERGILDSIPCSDMGGFHVTSRAPGFPDFNDSLLTWNYSLTQPIEAQQKTIDVAGRDIKVGVQPQMLEAMARMIPLGRGGTPEEAADAVYLFCSPESNYISGQVLVCGGGLIV